MWHIAALKFCFKTCVAMKFVDDDDDDGWRYASVSYALQNKSSNACNSERVYMYLPIADSISSISNELNILRYIECLIELDVVYTVFPLT